MSLWDAAVEATNNVVTTADFESAAYRLVAEQVIYDADRNSRVAYSLIRDFEREFRRALDPLGISVRVNSILRYACAIPRHAKSATASVEQTLLALVLRRVFEEETQAGMLDENGEITCDLESLRVRYIQATGGREMPSGGRLRTLMKTMQRWGIARITEDDDAPNTPGVEQPFLVMIRPGIVEVLGEAALQRLALFTEPEDSAGQRAGEPADGDQGEELDPEDDEGESE